MKIPNKTIVIEIEDGQVSNVFVNGDCSVLVVDHDARKVGEKSTGPGWLRCDEPSKATGIINTIVARKLRSLAR